MANRFYFGHEGGDDGIEGRGGDYVPEAEPTFCDDCDETIEGAVICEAVTAPTNGRKYVLSFCASCAALRAESRAA